MMAMAVIHPSIFEVIKRFPEHRSGILDLYHKNELFRNTCQDYKKCKEALFYWSSLDSENSAMRRSEYGELLLSLENEIINDLTGGVLPKEA